MCTCGAEGSPVATAEEPSYDRFPGQRTEANITILDHAFSNDPVRYTILSRIRASTWLKSHLLEPTFGAQDGVTHGLDLSGLGMKKKESVYQAFLEDGTGGCLFPSVDGGKGGECGKKEKRPLRALAHIRSHLGHSPFACDGCYKCDERDGKARFFSHDLLQEHKKAEESRKECPFCHKSYGRSAYDRHVKSKHM